MNWKKSRKEAEQELKKAQTEIKKEHYTGEIPSEETLFQTRQKREHGWQLLRRQWLDHEDVTKESLAYAPDQPLPEPMKDMFSRWIILPTVYAVRLTGLQMQLLFVPSWKHSRKNSPSLTNHDAR